MDQAEQLRNIIKVNQQRPVVDARVITITSGKGGAGKSNSAVNIAVQLQKMGKKVIIFDADFGLANVEVMFGAIPTYNLSDLLYKGKNIKEIITEGPMNVGFVSGGSGINGLNNLTKDQISFLVRNLAELDSMADFIIVDTGAGIADSVLEFVMASSEVLLIITPEPTSLTDSYSLLKALHRNPEFSSENTKIKVISNKAASDDEGKSMFSKLNAVVSKFLRVEIEFLGMIPQDAQLEKSVMQQKPVSLYSPTAKSAKAFEKIASSLLDQSDAEIVEKKGFAYIFSKFINKSS